MTSRRHRAAKGLLCLVSDRRRLSEALGRPEEWRRLLLRQIEGAVAGGVDFVQIRERDLDAAALAALVRDVARIAAGSGTRILVNDRADIAIAGGADGVHLRDASVRATEIRRFAPELVVGRSVHTTTSAADTGADYLIAGSVFASASKSAASPLLGLQGLADIVDEAAPTPVLAIGGVTEAVIEQVVRAGVAGVAGIGAYIPSDLADDLSIRVEKTVKNLRFAFDSASTVS